jgi:hypothetical protein
MSRKVLLGGLAAVAVTTAALMIPAGGGANVPNNTPFVPAIRQGGVTVNSVTVVCPPGATSGAPVSAISAIATASPTGIGNTGNGDRIAVIRSGSTKGTITTLGTAVTLNEPTLPCTAGSVTYTFQPKKSNGDNAGVPHSVAVAIVTVPSAGG